MTSQPNPPRRSLISPEVEAQWRDAYSYRAEPVVVEVPLISWLMIVAVAIATFIALMLMWPNP